MFKYSNPELDALLDAGREETAVEGRRDIYKKVQATLACDGPVLFLAYGQLYTAMREAVEGYQIYPNRSLGSLKSVTLGN